MAQLSDIDFSNVFYCDKPGCKFSTQTAKKLKNHRKNKHPFLVKCSYGCGYTSDKRYRVVRHEKSRHPIPVATRREQVQNSLPPLMSAGEDPMWGNPEAWQEPDLTAMPVAEMFETSVNMAPVKPIMQQPAVQPPIPVHQQQLPATVHQKPLLPLTVTVPCPAPVADKPPVVKDAEVRPVLNIGCPEPTGVAGLELRRVRAEVADIPDDAISRFWEKPSLLPGGAVFRRYTESTVVEGKEYTIKLEEIWKPLNMTQESHSSSESRKSRSKSSRSSSYYSSRKDYSRR